MATITITNLTSSPIYLRDFYTTIGAAGAANTAVGPAATLTLSSAFSGNSSNQGGAVQVVRSAIDIAKMHQIQELVAAGSITVNVVADASEIGSGLAGGEDAAGYLAVQEVAAASLASIGFEIRVPMLSGGATGTADDVSVFALNSLPFKFRILDVMAYVSTAGAGGSTLQLFSHTSAGGTTLSAAVAASGLGVARAAGTSFTATAATPISATDGVFIHRSDRSTVGEFLISCRRET